MIATLSTVGSVFASRSVRSERFYCNLHVKVSVMLVIQCQLVKIQSSVGFMRKGS